MNTARMNILRYGTCLLVFFLPFVYFGHRIYPHISSKTFFFYGVVEILTAVWIYTIIVDASYRLPKKTWLSMMPIFGYVVWMTIAGIYAVNPALSWWSSVARGTGLLTLYHSLALLLILASLTYRHGIEYVKVFFGFLVGGGFILALSVWFGSAGFNLPFTALQTDGGGGMTGNSSLAAVYLLFVIGFGIFLMTAKHVTARVKWGIGATVAIILLSPLFIDMHGAFLGQSLLGSARAVILGLIVSIGSACGLWLIFTPKKITRAIGISLAVVALGSFVLGWVKLVTPSTYLHQKFTSAASGTRFIFWNEAQKAMDERPLLGYGPENYPIAFAHYFDPKMLLPEYHYEGWNDRAHNLYYDIGVSGGYPAIILYFLFLISIFYGLFVAERQGTLTRIQTSILGGLIVGYLFQDLFYFDSVLSYVALFGVAGIIYALGAPVPDKNQKKNKNTSTIDPYFKNLIAIALGIGCVSAIVFFSYQPAEKTKVYATMFSSQNKNYSELLSGSSVGEQRDVSGLAYGVYQKLAENPLTVKNNATTLPYTLRDVTSLLAYLESVAQKNKTDYRLYISMVDLYNTRTFLSDSGSDSVLTKHLFELLDTAHALSPTEPEVYWLKAQIYAWSGDFKSIIESYKEAIRIDPSLPVSHQLLLKFLKAIGDQKGYREALAQVEKDIPGFIPN